MPSAPKKPPGHSWDVYFVYLEDGEDDSMQVEGCWTAEEAIAKARDALNAYAKSDDDKDQFEIVAVIRSDAEI
ncbi:hypothetical protein ASD45_07125 [Pseudolabrys sp. Root1462]|uniref:hypothetical protein n=1 Tax=Pseudolabrys sp. Root1462 TaxID=1736466 RepID=UPI000702CA02|nr:hypothetical protein [Pseudolabrys sp. Root1462]KQZ00650.1 hypothetical protein ASD45_07125 [Pseudolabrys sp. Root1462]